MIFVVLCEAKFTNLQIWKREVMVSGYFVERKRQMMCCICTSEYNAANNQQINLPCAHNLCF
jgi:hypothetical protein